MPATSEIYKPLDDASLQGTSQQWREILDDILAEGPGEDVEKFLRDCAQLKLRFAHAEIQLLKENQKSGTLTKKDLYEAQVTLNEALYAGANQEDVQRLQKLLLEMEEEFEEACE